MNAKRDNSLDIENWLLKKRHLPSAFWFKFKEPLLSVPQNFLQFQFIMERDFEKSLCLGTGISFLFLLFLTSVPNGFILTVLYRNPLRCFRKAFSVFWVFICAVDLFIGIVVCSGETLMRFLCAFDDQRIPQEGDILRILGYIGLNSSILLVTAMSIDRFVAVIFPHFYRRKIEPRTLKMCNAAIVMFSSIFALLQLSGISVDVYRLIDQHLHATFPLSTTSLAYLGIFYFLKKQSWVSLQNQPTLSNNTALHNRRREAMAIKERKLAITSFFILLFLVISLVPYFVAILIEVNCHSCGKQNWFFALRESCVVFLFLNSIANPFLMTFRINDLKKSVRIVLGLSHQGSGPREDGSHLPTTSMRNNRLILYDL